MYKSNIYIVTCIPSAEREQENNKYDDTVLYYKICEQTFKNRPYNVRKDAKPRVIFHEITFMIIGPTESTASLSCLKNELLHYRP